MHNLKSFLSSGLKEWTTWVGVSVLCFVILYHSQINQLIINILTNPLLANKAIEGIGSFLSFSFILYKQRK